MSRVAWVMSGRQVATETKRSTRMSHQASADVSPCRRGGVANPTERVRLLSAIVCEPMCESQPESRGLPSLSGGREKKVRESDAGWARFERAVQERCAQIRE